jgi:hypothetical protein
MGYQILILAGQTVGNNHERVITHNTKPLLIRVSDRSPEIFKPAGGAYVM